MNLVNPEKSCKSCLMIFFGLRKSKRFEKAIHISCLVCIPEHKSHRLIHSISDQKEL